MLIRILISTGLAFMIILVSALIVYIMVKANDGELWATILLGLVILLMVACVTYQVIYT